jgi:hypothetical protein
MIQHRFIFRPVFALLINLCAAGWLLPRSAQAQSTMSVREIMEKVTTTRKLDGSEATLKMTVIDEKGQTREREITIGHQALRRGQDREAGLPLPGARRRARHGDPGLRLRNQSRRRLDLPAGVAQDAPNSELAGLAKLCSGSRPRASTSCARSSPRPRSR